MRYSLLLFTLLTLSTTMLHAGGPWPQAPGKAYLKLSEWWTVFDQHYTDAGLLDPNVTTGIFNTTFYAEYGITDRFTTIINAPLFSRNYVNNLRSTTTGELIQSGDAVNSLGDIDLGIKYGLTKPGSKFPVAATLILGLPTGRSVAGIQNNLQTGDGEFNQILQIETGTSFQLGKKVNSYASVYLGVNNRSNGFSEELRYGVEWGLGLMDQRLWFIGRLNSVESFKNGETAATVTSTSIFANNTEFSGVALEVAYYLKGRWGISASVAGAFRGEIIAAAPAYSVGIFYDLNKIN
ncbi:MAG: hypothetical protein ACRBG0_06705 [Lewinella sp.]|uniref:hypothetical protein n=1 Tax=Lewinella sp. TaxID=2004506 RepID=UPI003D6A238E